MSDAHSVMHCGASFLPSEGSSRKPSVFEVSNWVVISVQYPV